MSARKAKNEASTLKLQTGNIADLVDININGNNKVKEEIEKDFQLEGNKNVDINTEVKEEVDNDIKNEGINTTDRMKELKKKMRKGRESNKQVTVYLTPENYKRFNKLTAKGEKSELINQLLDMYFED